MIILTDLQRQLVALSDDQRARVIAIVRRHIAACRRQGAMTEPPSRVLREALELVLLEDASGQRQIDDWSATTIGAGLQRQQYEVYSSPTEL